MRIAVVSDIHANYVALERVLEDLQREHIDRTVCLGDVLQGGPQPIETSARLRALGWPIVMGNADYFLLTGRSKEPHSEKQSAVREWSFKMLSKSDLDFVNGFQPTVEIALEDRRLVCFHGSPTSFDDIIFPETPESQVSMWLEPFKNCILAGGHTHLQQIRPNGELFFFNPGSIGLAYGSRHSRENSRLDDWAEYAILTVDTGRLALEFRRVQFTLEALVRAYQTSGRPFAEEMIAQYTRQA